MADLRDYTKKNPIFVGTDGIRLPIGNNAQRTASSNVAGTMRYNTDINGIETYTSSGWRPLAAPPSIATVSPTVYSGESGTQFIINGEGFTPDAQVYFVTANNTALLAASVSYYSPVQVRATTPRAITVQEEPISVRVVQQSGTVTLTNCIDAGGVPNWVTTAGTLGSIFGANTVNVYVTATDPEGTAVSYQLSSGSLPNGLSLSANGLVQGLANSVLANTTYNFVIKANDTVNNNTDRSFSYTVLNRAPVINTAAGSLGTIFSGNAVPSTTISAYDPDGGQLTFTRTSGNIVNTSVGSANGTIVGTPIVVTTNTVYTIGITATDEGSCTASNTYTFTVLNRPPLWNTAATLPSANADGINSVTVNAYDPDGGSVTYSVISGSLPTGITLNSSNGAFVGTSDDVPSNTSYSFTVSSTDVGNDSNNRTFSFTLTPVTDNNFSNTVLLLKTSGNTAIKDASPNNLNVIVSGDTRATNFSPYNTSWSNFFSAASNSFWFFDTTYNGVGTVQFTLEAWVYPTANVTNQNWFAFGNSNNAYGNALCAMYDLGKFKFLQGNGSNANPVNISSTNNFQPFQWYHIAVSKDASGVIRLFVNGVLEGNQTYTTNVVTPTRVVVNGLSDSAGVGDRGGSFLISNLRLIVGEALYTSAFTPPGALTQTANTTVLTCISNRFENRANSNSAITTVGTPKVSGFSPFTETDTTSGSMYFDGSGDALEITSNSSVDLSTGDFTIEAWVYPTVKTNTIDALFGYGAYTTMLYHNGTSWSWEVGNGSSNYFTITAPVTLNSWQHVALTRSGSTFTFWLNGTSRSTGSNAGSVATSGRSLFIGFNNSLSTERFTGYASNFRIVKGTAVYTANTTPPTSALTPITNTTLLTLQNRQPHNNHGFQDSSNNKHLITRSGNPTQGSFTPFSDDPGKWSIYQPDVSVDYITFTSGIGSNLQFTGDYTVEAYVYPVRFDGDTTLYLTSDGTNYHAFNLDGTNFNIYFQSTGSTAIAHGMRLNSWNHVAMVRSGSTVTLYTNGVSKGTITSGITHGYANPSLARTGGGIGGSPRYISNLRVLKGTALYTGAFTPPTNPLTNITNTVLLTSQSNRYVDNSTANSGSGFTIGSTGSVAIKAFSPFSPNVSYTTANTGGSGYFDGSGDWLILPNDPAFDISTSTFTFEGWFYTNSTAIQTIISRRESNANYSPFQINIESGGAISFSYSSTGSSWATSLNSVNTTRPYTWNHFAFVRSGSNLRCYLNGRYESQTNSFSNPMTTTSRVSVAAAAVDGLGGNYQFNGYISGLRLVRQELYTGTTTYTVPTAPATSTANTTMLLNFTDAAIVDYTNQNDFETVGDAKANNTIQKFTPGSMYFDGTGDSLVSYNNIAIGTSDYTVEAWVYKAVAGTGVYSIFCTGPGGSSDNLRFGVNNNGIYLDIYGVNPFVSVGTVPDFTWTHVAVTRTGGTLRAFVNGILVSSTTTSGSTFITGTQWYAGILGTTGGAPGWNGSIQDLRVSRVARYTANTTPPIRSFPNR